MSISTTYATRIAAIAAAVALPVSFAGCSSTASDSPTPGATASSAPASSAPASTEAPPLGSPFSDGQ